MGNLRQEFYDEIEKKNPGNASEILFQSNLQAYVNWLTDKVNKYKPKADKWDKLDEEISKYYPEDGSEEEGDLSYIGEAAAIAFGYL